MEVRLVYAHFVRNLGSSHYAVRALAGQQIASGFDLDFFGSFFINGKKNNRFSGNQIRVLQTVTDAEYQLLPINRHDPEKHLA